MAAESGDANEKSAFLINAVRCYADLGRLAEAERILGEIRELAPDDSEVRFAVDFGAACVTAQGGQHEKAVALFEGMLKEYDELLRTSEYRDFYEETQCRRAFSLTHLKKYREAISAVSEAGPFRALKAEIEQETHLYLGTCYTELGERQPAKQEFLRAVGFNLKNDTDAQARYHLGVLYFLDSGFAQARHQLEAILENYPQEIPNVPRKDIYLQLSRVYHYLGEKENAKRYAKLAESPSELE